MKAQTKTHKSGKSYIGVKATCTMYGLQGQANEEKEYYLHFNSDGTIDFNPYSCGFNVHEIEEDIVWLNREWKLFAGNQYQFAVIPRAAYESAIEAGWNETDN